MDYFLDNFIVFVQNLLQLLKLLLIEYIYLVFKIINKFELLVLS